MPSRLEEFAAGQIWLCTYPVKMAIVEFSSRMTVIRLDNGKLVLHSPCEIDTGMRDALGELGEVGYIVAPGTFHHLHVASAQAAFPAAQTLICPGVEVKRRDLHFEAILGDHPPAAWAGQIDQVVMRGSRWMWEVAFFHRRSRTLILVDLIEKFTDETADVDWTLKFWWKLVRMWNTAKPAPEYQLGWSDRKAARAAMERILQWSFDRVVIAHGDLIETNARQVVEQAWKRLLRPGSGARVTPAAPAPPPPL